MRTRARRLAGAILRRLLSVLPRTAVRLGDLVAARLPRHAPLRADWRPGVSVVIPECGTPELLARCLGQLAPALDQLDEPWEIIVVVNGAPADSYRTLQERFPEVDWQFHARPLGFGGAIARGLAAARQGAILLLNSDMALEPPALGALLRWRDPAVFAVAAQILFDDPGRRREETGWGDLRSTDSRSELFDRDPPPDGQARGALYAGGGASLFDAALLRRFAAGAQGYAPFYWEDADWGMQAWQHGLEVVFEPAALAWHRHRATIGRLYPRSEIDRIVARNGLFFDLRHGPRQPLRRALLSGIPPVTGLELASPRRLAEIFRGRLERRRAPCGQFDPASASARLYRRPRAGDARPLLLVVTPFCILPPRHGGAWRTWRLCEALSARWRIVLLSDEPGAHDATSWVSAQPFESVHLVGGRPDGAQERIARIRDHSHARLQAELDRLVAVLRPDVVQIEHVELAGLEVPAGVPSLMVAHDVLITGDAAEADRFERERLATFGARVVCSAEDARLLAPLPTHIVPNGAVIGAPGAPSAGRHSLLFAGPFRYRPNLDGLRTFVARVYPALRARFPDLRLVVLGGAGAPALAASDPLLTSPGIEVHDNVDDVRPWLAACALGINPLAGTRGSSVKLIETLAAGRVCVTTRDGARGFLDAGLDALIAVDGIEAMDEPIARLLADEPARLALEATDRERLRDFSWTASAERLERVYHDLLSSDLLSSDLLSSDLLSSHPRSAHDRLAL